MSLYSPDLGPLICLCLQLTHPRGEVPNSKMRFAISLTTEASQHDATFGTVSSFPLFQLARLPVAGLQDELLVCALVLPTLTHTAHRPLRGTFEMERRI